jgi:hypothetical protein
MHGNTQTLNTQKLLTLTKMLIIIWFKQRNGNTSIQIFENLNYRNKNIVSAYFPREKAEKICKNEM